MLCVCIQLYERNLLLILLKRLISRKVQSYCRDEWRGGDWQERDKGKKKKIQTSEESTKPCQPVVWPVAERVAGGGSEEGFNDEI